MIAPTCGVAYLRKDSGEPDKGLGWQVFCPSKYQGGLEGQTAQNFLFFTDPSRRDLALLRVRETLDGCFCNGESRFCGFTVGSRSDETKSKPAPLCRRVRKGVKDGPQLPVKQLTF